MRRKYSVKVAGLTVVTSNPHESIHFRPFTFTRTLCDTRKNENLSKENRQVGGDSLERTVSNSSTEGSSDGSSNIGCQFTKNFMKESLESVVPAAPQLAIGLRSSAPSSGDSLNSSEGFSN